MSEQSEFSVYYQTMHVHIDTTYIVHLPLTHVFTLFCYLQISIYQHRVDELIQGVEYPAKVQQLPCIPFLTHPPGVPGSSLEIDACNADYHNYSA